MKKIPGWATRNTSRRVLLVGLLFLAGLTASYAETADEVWKTLAGKKNAAGGASGSGVDISVGLGGSVEALTHPEVIYSYLGSPNHWGHGFLNFDFEAFIDFTYLQVSAGYLFVYDASAHHNDATGWVVPSPLSDRFTWVTGAAYLKYPLTLGWVKLFPLLGAQFRYNLTYTDTSGNDLKSSLSTQEKNDLNELWIEAGLGIDLSLGHFFIRPEVLVGFKPLSNTDFDTLIAAYDSGYTDAGISYLRLSVDLLLGWRF